MMTSDSRRLARWSWGTVAWAAITVFVIGCVLSSIAISIGVDHNPDDDEVALAFLAVFVAYVPGAVIGVLALLLGPIGWLRAPALVVIALVNLAVGVWWAYLIWPGDSACLMGCGSGGQHGVIPAATTVLLWVTAALHIVSAPIFALAMGRPRSETTSADRG